MNYPEPLLCNSSLSDPILTFSNHLFPIQSCSTHLFPIQSNTSKSPQHGSLSVKLPLIIQTKKTHHRYPKQISPPCSLLADKNLNSDLLVTAIAKFSSNRADTTLRSGSPGSVTSGNLATKASKSAILQVLFCPCFKLASLRFLWLLMKFSTACFSGRSSGLYFAANSSKI